MKDTIKQPDNSKTNSFNIGLSNKFSNDLNEHSNKYSSNSLSNSNEIKRKMKIINANEPRNLYKLKVVYDSLSEEEEYYINSYEQKHIESKMINLKSNSFLYIFYFCFRVSIIFLYFIFFLYFFSFNPLPIKEIIKGKYSFLNDKLENKYESYFVSFSCLLDIFYCLVFVIDLFKDYETEDGIRFALDYKIIFKNCIKNSFILDFLISFPFYLFLLIFISNSRILDFFNTKKNNMIV